MRRKHRRSNQSRSDDALDLFSRRHLQDPGGATPLYECVGHVNAECTVDVAHSRSESNATTLWKWRLHSVHLPDACGRGARGRGACGKGCLWKGVPTASQSASVQRSGCMPRLFSESLPIRALLTGMDELKGDGAVYCGMPVIAACEPASASKPPAWYVRYPFLRWVQPGLSHPGSRGRPPPAARLTAAATP